MKSPSQVVAFRVSAELLQLLDEAREPLNLSRGDWVRSAAVEKLRQLNQAKDLESEVTELRQVVTELDAQVKKVHSNLARTLFILLTTAGLSSDDARSIVREKLVT